MTTNSKINILYIIDFFRGIGGTETHLTRLIELLDKKKYTATVVIFDYLDNHLTRRITAAGGEIIPLRVARYYTPNALKKGIQLFKLIKQKKIHIVHTFHYKADTYGALISYLAGVRVIVSSKRDVSDFKNAFRFFMHRRARHLITHYIAVAEPVKQITISKEKVLPQKISVIYNGVDLKNFPIPDPTERSQNRDSLHIPHNDFVIGMVAVMRIEKNHKSLIKAFQKFNAEIPASKLVLVGGGPCLERHKIMVKDLGLTNAVIFTGFQQNIYPYLSIFDIACLIPYINEGFSNSIIEKMAMGLPIIATNVGGNREAILHQENGLVIPPNDIDALTEAIFYLYNHPQQRLCMGKKSRQRTEDFFTLSKMVESHENLYNTLLSKQSHNSMSV